MVREGFKRASKNYVGEPFRAQFCTCVCWLQSTHVQSKIKPSYIIHPWSGVGLETYSLRASLHHGPCIVAFFHGPT